MTPDNALARLEAMCARAEHCAGEMREKLRGWKIPQADADKIVASLIEHRFVDDARFARAYARDKLLFSKWGKRKIAQGLALKRVDRDIARQAIEELDRQTYERILSEVLASRARLDPDMLDTYEGRVKLLRFAMQRGFESALASQRIKAMASHDS